MPVKPFSDSLLKQILNPIDHFLKTTAGPHCAAFDADGTLWDSDVGENYFQYKIDHCDLPALQGIDPWAHYKKLKAIHPPDAYLWLAQICKDVPVETVRDWAKKAIEKFPLAVFEPQAKLIRELRDRHIEVYVVSASVHWAVEAALSLVGLTKDCAMGVKTKVVNGLVTTEQDGPITWREGKREALLLKTNNLRPLLSSGNSSGDIHLLECAQTVRLAIQTQKPDSKHRDLFKDEQKLLQLASEKGWLTHRF